MKTNWISVKKELPPYGEQVLVAYSVGNKVVTKIGTRSSTDRNGEHWQIFNNHDANNSQIQFWTPMPEPPEDYKNTNNKTTEL